MNLVMIVSDTLRWDYLGAYGNDWIQTPSLDALAAESALFLDAYAEALPTVPARRALMTGRHCFPFWYRPQKSDGVELPGWHPLFDEDVTLAEHLVERGYHTAFFNDVYHLMKPGKNFHRGFEQWFWIRGQEADAYGMPDAGRVRHLLDRVLCGREEIAGDEWVIRHLVLRDRWKSDADTVVAQTMRAAAEWVRGYSLDKPFYLHVEVFDPHEPWDPPAEFARAYEPNYGDSLQGCFAPGRTDGLTEQEIANVRAAYAGEVTLVDKWTGRLLDALRETGRMDDTVVVFTSDHGCMLGERGEIHKGMDRLRNQCTRLPLLIRHPSGEGAGKRVRGFCQHQDIMPTVLGLLGKEAPARVTGRDVWSQVRGGGEAPDCVVSGFGPYACIRSAKWNLISPWVEPGEARNHGAHEGTVRRQLYDLEADGEELTDAAEGHPDVVEELSKRLEEHIRRFLPLTDGTIGGKSAKRVELTFHALPGSKD
ncbi:MAG: sulfatase [Planctomycetota bacterium]